MAFARARDACLAAVEAQRRLDAVDWPEHAHIGVRMGIHTGEAVERDGDYFGPAVNRAARLAAASNARQIVVSLATEQMVREHLPRDHSLADLGELRVAGVVAPLPVFGLVAGGLVEGFPPLRQARAARSNVPHSVQPLVGRESEIAGLVERLRGHRLVTLTGPGGVGKTSMALTAASATTDDFPDGTWGVELVPVTAADDIARQSRQALAYSGKPPSPLLIPSPPPWRGAARCLCWTTANTSSQRQANSSTRCSVRRQP